MFMVTIAESSYIGDTEMGVSVRLDLLKKPHTYLYQKKATFVIDFKRQLS